MRLIWALLCLLCCFCSKGAHLNFEYSNKDDPKAGSRFNKNFTAVYFNPSIPIDFLDSYDMDEETMTSLLTVIHTEFDHIVVSMDFFKSVLETVATLNREKPNKIWETSLHATVRCRFETGVYTSKYFNETAQFFAIEIKAIEKVYPGTITNVVFATEDSSFNEKGRDAFVIFQEKICGNSNAVMRSCKHKFILELIIPRCNEPADSWKSIANLLIPNKVDLILLSSFPPPDKPDTKNAVANYIQNVQNYLDSCAQHKARFNISAGFGIFSTWPDTTEDGKVSYSDLVAQWNHLNILAENSKIPVVFGQAFDSHQGLSLVWLTSGFWQMIPTDDINGTDFRLIIKDSIPDPKPKPSLVNNIELLNMSWLTDPLQFSKENTAIDISSFSFTQFSYHILELIVRTTVSKVCSSVSKIFFNVEEGNSHFYETYNSIPKKIAKLNSNQLDEMFTRVFLYVDKSDPYYMLRMAAEANRVFPGTVTHVVFLLNADNFYVNQFVAAINLFRKQVNDRGRSFPYKIGANLVVSDVGVGGHILEGMWLKRISELELKVEFFVLTNVVTSTNIKLGLERVIPHLISKFLRFKKRVTNFFENRNQSVDVALATGWPHTFENDKTDYISAIRFWEWMNKWAEETNNTVIFIGAFDTKVKEERLNGYGWWKIEEHTANHSVNIKMTTLKETVLKIALTKPTEPIKKTEFPVLEASIGIGFFLFLTTVAVICGKYWLLKNKRYLVEQGYVDGFFKGENESTDDSTQRTYMSVPYDKKIYEVPKAKYVIDESSPLGQGEFGKTCLATIKRNEDAGIDEIQVAVKMLKVPFPPTSLLGLLSEIKVLAYLGKHEHIVELMGAYTEGVRSGNVFVFLELCPFGSLEKYLRDLGAQQLAEENDGPIVSADTTNDLLRWSQEIACGLDYIASKHVVHADVATRNVLLNAQRQAKICDFGLSRRLANYQSYVKTQQEPLPWCWMSPESLQRMEFNEKTDVWSFGITLWEIYSLGDKPYAGLSWDVQFPTKLINGLRLGPPKIPQDGIYTIMLRCWSIQPHCRPNFTQLNDMLLELKSDTFPVENLHVEQSLNENLPDECDSVRSYLELQEQIA